jgi:hypothetical protein
VGVAHLPSMHETLGFISCATKIIRIFLLSMCIFWKV